MKRLSAVLIIFLCGCAVTDEGVSVQDMSRRTEEAKMSEMSRRFLSLSQIHEGMTRDGVKSILGQQIVVGYELADENGDQYKPLTATNPFRSEQLRKGGKVYDVDYYFVGIKQADDQVADDELVPLVFTNNVLVGTGWLYLNQQVKGE